ncbi:hypothetical protein R2F25_00940 [Streptomyces sp. UP1A-1]|nr:hypothetical protein [Streptomyces sp. UP1A-1]
MRGSGMTYDELATTGSGLSLFGIALGQTWLVAVAFALTLARRAPGPGHVPAGQGRR